MTDVDSFGTNLSGKRQKILILQMIFDCMSVEVDFSDKLFKRIVVSLSKSSFSDGISVNHEQNLNYMLAIKNNICLYRIKRNTPTLNVLFP